LSPFGHYAEEGEAGVDACLSKPVKQSKLCNCLSKLVAGTRALTITPQILSTVTRRSPAVSLPHASRKTILLAEDNVINQKVALRLLQKLGYTAIHVVADGREAVAAMETTHYDVILMDCQMPLMDGYKATAAIRDRETGDRRVPIIALTAHALEDERAKCLTAGMDDHISKPVKIEELGRVVAHWANVSSSPIEEVSIA
jgi:CheY-like chemotaxis protein